MNKLENEIEYIFYKKYNIQTMCTNRTIKNKKRNGIEINKQDLKTITELLEKYKIPYKIHNGKYLDTNYNWKGKNLKFIEIKEHIRYYKRIIEGENL